MIHKKDYTFIMSDKLPEDTRGDHSIEKIALEKGTMTKMYSAVGYFYHDKVDSSIPTVRLSGGGNSVMSDTPMEQEGLRVPVMVARGRVLIIGLGIGLFPTLLGMYNRNVKSILIVEQSQDVARLVYPHIKNRKTDLRICDGKKFLMACADKFDFIFIDVWSAITTTITEIDTWTELAKPCLAEGGEIRCWLQELYDRIKDKLPKEPMQQTSSLVVHEPCLICGKKLRFDYAGLCMDCADDMEVSEMYI